jgi:hypothetical protein
MQRANDIDCRSEVSGMPKHKQKHFHVVLNGFVCQGLENFVLNSSAGAVTHMALRIVEFNAPFAWIIYPLHTALCNVSESTFTMNVFRFWRSGKCNSLWTFLCEPCSVQHYWQICLICRHFSLYDINWIGFYSIKLLKNLIYIYISKSKYGGDLVLWLACLCTVNSSFM